MPTCKCTRILRAGDPSRISGRPMNTRHCAFHDLCVQRSATVQRGGATNAHSDEVSVCTTR